MELRRLRYFTVVAAEGSLGAASRTLGIAQPALSRQMRLLEAELGVALFQRVASGMRLTEEGDYLRESIAHPMQRLDITFENLRSFATRVEATCTLGLPPEVSDLLGLPLMRRLGAELPNLKLRLVEEVSSHLAVELVRGTIDVAILSGITPDDRLFQAEILSEPILLVGASGSDLATQASMPFCDLEDYPLILPGRPASLTTRLEKLAARTGTKIVATHEVDSLRITKELVKAKAGYALLPAVAVRGELSTGELVASNIHEPDLTQGVHFAVNDHWRVPSSIYLTFHRAFYDEWARVVDNGSWPASWIFDRNELSRLFA